nr:DNA-directed RNA polymerase subunit beta' [Haematococcus lacustris]AUW36480.1 DNA-directed RNA polymerase subunit beta' [Haematococcus lacustris]
MKYYKSRRFIKALRVRMKKKRAHLLTYKLIKERAEKTGKKGEIALFSSMGEKDITIFSAFYSGPGMVQQLLDLLNFNEIQKLDKQNRYLLYQLNKIILKLKKQVQIFIFDKKNQNLLKEYCKKREFLIRRTKLVRKLFRKDSNPSTMLITILPVLPPDLRPIVKMGNQIAAADLNRLYQKVIYRNERLKKFLKDPATCISYEMKYAQRLLQEAVDNLLQNGKSGPLKKVTTGSSITGSLRGQGSTSEGSLLKQPEKDSRGRALKSLSDSLKGKQGRFRQFLLGKRVDYSGRTVIVVGPKLKLHECGLPIEMAKVLYLPFLLKIILNKNYAKTVIGAKNLIKNNPALTIELLREILQVSPVLLNRAPTLHRLGFQAFIPKLIEGRAILLHPLVCSAFNADFDGDQMAVHVPITIEARAEAWKLMLARNNMLSPATGEPLTIPSQDMVLGCYYLTTTTHLGNLRFLKGTGLTFKNFYDVLKAYNNNSTGPSQQPSPYLKKTKGLWAEPPFSTTSLFPSPSSASFSAFGFGKEAAFGLLEGTVKRRNLHTWQRDWKTERGKIDLHALIWVQWNGLLENENIQEEPLEIRLDLKGSMQEIAPNTQILYDCKHFIVNQYMATTPGRILFNLLIRKHML